MKKKIRKSGFTPLEMLTALSVLSLVMLAFGSMVFTAMNSIPWGKERPIEPRFAGKSGWRKEISHLAEAGLRDAQSRLQTGTNGVPIHDRNSSDPRWTAFIGSAEQAIEKGYQSHSANHSRYDRLDSALDYVVTVRHKLDESGRVLKWGDSNNDGRPEENSTVGESIYVITSEGYGRNGRSKALSIEAAKVPPIKAAAALYSKADATLQGSSTYVQGLDSCGGHPVPGVLSREGVRLNGDPAISGFPSATVEDSPVDVDVQYLMNQFKRKANHQYNVHSATLQGKGWGSPAPGATPRDPSSCSLRNIVYFNTNGTYVRLSGGSHGCGILLVEGDLSVHGGFQWYGIILVTGSITFTGGGGKNVTGAVMAGGRVSADLVGGDANIIFCSRAVGDQTDALPLVVLRWADPFSEPPELKTGKKGIKEIERKK